jgi:hypothetical protein
MFNDTFLNRKTLRCTKQAGCVSLNQERPPLDWLPEKSEAHTVTHNPKETP